MTWLISHPCRSSALCLFSAIFLLAACTPLPGPTPPASMPPATTEPPPTAGLPTATATFRFPVSAQTAIPRPREQSDLKTLTICTRSEPDTLFLFPGLMYAKSQILEAVYDGPIDSLGFDYQPVILEKLPSLADGDAWIEAVGVKDGDRVLNAAGEFVRLSVGEVVLPFGCSGKDCAVSWDGGPLRG